MNTSLGIPPWLEVVWPKPRPGNITARTATIAATTATAAHALDAVSLLIALLLCCESGRVSRGEAEDEPTWFPSEQARTGRVTLAAGEGFPNPSGAIAAWGDRNQRSCTYLSGRSISRCAASKGFLPCPPTPPKRIAARLVRAGATPPTASPTPLGTRGGRQSGLAIHLRLPVAGVGSVSPVETVGAEFPGQGVVTVAAGQGVVPIPSGELVRASVTG